MAKKKPKTKTEAINDHNNPSDLPNKELFRVYEVAQYFQVHEKTIRLWVSHGKLVAEKPVGIIYITKQSIINFRLSGQGKVGEK